MAAVQRPAQSFPRRWKRLLLLDHGHQLASHRRLVQQKVSLPDEILASLAGCGIARVLCQNRDRAYPLALVTETPA